MFFNMKNVMHLYVENVMYLKGATYNILKWKQPSTNDHI